MKPVTRFPGACALLVLLASTAAAVPLSYTLGGGSVDANSHDPGLVINTEIHSGLPGTSFTLNDGTGFNVNFFDIWTDETYINPDDQQPIAISATLNFTDPAKGVTIDGITVGGSLIFGLAQWGQVTWNGPVTVTLDDRVFTVTLTNEVFNFGIFGINGGQGFGATVEANIFQNGSSSVPDHGSTLALSGLAFTATFLMRRKLPAA